MYDNNIDSLINSYNDTKYKRIADTGEIYKVTNRTISLNHNTNLAVERDSMSQILSFQIPRYFDNVDLSNKAVYIKFTNANEESDRSAGINKKVDDETITVGWLLDSKVTAKKGEVKFAVEFLGYDENNNFYCWSTTPAVLNIAEGLNVDDNIEPLEPSWFQTYLLQIDNKIEKSLNELQESFEDKFYVLSDKIVPVDIGGVKAGTAPFSEKVSCSDALFKIIYPYIPPVITITSDINKPQEVGTTSKVILTINSVKGSEPIQSIKLYKNESFIKEFSNVSEGGIYSYTDNNISSTAIFKAVINDGTEETSSISEIEFVYPVYFGMTITDSPTSTEIKYLSKQISNTRNNICSYSGEKQYMCYCYPQSYGKLEEINSVNTNFSLIDEWEYKNINIYFPNGNSIPYCLYTSSKATLKNYQVKFI